MKSNKTNTASVIIPALLPTENGDYAVLLWDKHIVKRIRAAIIQGKSLYCYTVTGLDPTPYGMLAWLKCCVDTLDNFQSAPNNDLVWLDFVISPIDFGQRWLSALKQQQLLELAIPIDDQTTRLNKLIERCQLEQYLTSIEQARSEWHSRCNYPLAVQHLVSKVFPLIEQQGVEAIAATYSQELSLQQVLQRCVLQAAHQIGIELEADAKQLRLLRQQDNLEEFLSTPGTDRRSNLLKDWLFATICLEHSQSQSQLQIAVGRTETRKWAWCDLPLENTPEVLFHLSSSYRYLLQHNWKQLLTPLDVLVASVALHTIAELGLVPTRAAFNQLGSILQGALNERQFGMHSKTAIIIGKPGLEEIEFLPLSGAGAKCLFVVRLASQPIHRINLSLVGEIDATAGKIQAVGVEETPATKLLLFCVAITYRDLLVAQDIVSTPPDKKNNSKCSRKTRVKDRSTPLRLVARVKHSSTKIDSNFADPQKLVAALTKYSPYLRACHLRRLPEGTKARQNALELAAAYQFLVPPGYTFVRPTVVGSDESSLPVEFKSISLMNLLFEG